MTDAQKQAWIKGALAVGVLLGVAHFSKNAKVTAAALGAAGVVVAMRLPVVRDGFTA